LAAKAPEIVDRPSVVALASERSISAMNTLSRSRGLVATAVRESDSADSARFKAKFVDAEAADPRFERLARNSDLVAAPTSLKSAFAFCQRFVATDYPPRRARSRYSPEPIRRSEHLNTGCPNRLVVLPIVRHLPKTRRRLFSKPQNNSAFFHWLVRCSAEQA
jgi:hypothetical protein